MPRKTVLILQIDQLLPRCLATEEQVYRENTNTPTSPFIFRVLADYHQMIFGIG